MAQPPTQPSTKFRPLDEARPWNAAAQELECVMIIPETGNAHSFCFQSTDQSWFRYLPGQFNTSELPVNGEKLLRTYTMSSSPSRPLSLSITVKAKDDSIASRWMLNNLQVGDRIRAYGPGGIFSFHYHPADRYLFISAGSGITPMMSMTRWLFDYGRHTDITFIHCARRPSEIIFRSEIERMTARVPDIKLAWIVTHTDRYSAWTGFTGRFNQLMLELICPDFFEREIFCCGPEGFMQSTRDILHAASFDMQHYHEESFQAPITDLRDEPQHDDDIIPDEAAAAEIVFTTSDLTLACYQTDTILAAAKSAGLHIPSACQFGVCGTCKVKKVSGDVHMLHNGGINDADIEAGYVLACCSRPLGRVEIEY
jgi:ferredoxin-NADP reductase